MATFVMQALGCDVSAIDTVHFSTSPSNQLVIKLAATTRSMILKAHTGVSVQAIIRHTSNSMVDECLSKKLRNFTKGLRKPV